MQDQMTRHPTTFAGIDVGKEYLDIYVLPSGIRLKVKNEKKAIDALAAKLNRYGVELAAMEATGIYHRLAHTLLHAAGIATSIVSPFRSRQFANSTGRLAKTDTIDAESLALFAERMKPAPTAPLGEESCQLRDLTAARRQVLGEVSDLKRRLQAAGLPIAARQIRARIEMGERHKAILEGEIKKLIATQPDLQAKFDVLISIPGIGRTTAATLLSDLVELGQVNARQIAALAGVAPLNWDSGLKNGKRMIRGGRQHVRNALYMCAVSCIRRTNPIGATYRHLVRRGKNPKVALTATMRKLIVLANTLITENRRWQTERPAGVFMPGHAVMLGSSRVPA